MDLGVISYNTEWTMPAHELALAAEERGFESIWLPEHSHFPVSDLSDYPGYPGGVLPKCYVHMSDPLTGLAAAAAVTTTIKLGTGILLVNQHDPIVLAKQVATLDRLSNGRVLFGVGAGWNKVEMQNHGIEPAQRWPQLQERIQALKTLWADDESSFHGEFIDFDPVWSYPKPISQPHPPVILGSTISKVARRFVAEHCDGWIPTMTGDLGPAIAEVHQHCAEIGRDPATLPVSMLCVDQPEMDKLEAWAALGVVRTVVGVGDVGTDEVLKVLDRYAELIPKLA